MAKQANTTFLVKYRNIVLVVLGILFAIALETLPVFHPYLVLFGSLGFVGAVIAGMLLVSTFTVATGAVILGLLLPEMGIWQLTAVACLGAIIGDLIVYKLVYKNMVGESAQIYKKIGGSHLNRLLHTNMFRWTLPVLGAMLMYKPLSDKFGTNLLSASKISTIKFVAISLFLNITGIFFFASLIILVRSVM